MLIVTVAGVFLGWHLPDWRLVRARKAYAAHHVAHAYPGCLFVNHPPDKPLPFRIVGHQWHIEGAGISFWRRWLGDRAFGVVYADSEDDAKVAKALFPEAEVRLEKDR